MKISLVTLMVNLFAWGLCLYVFFFTEEVETYIFPKVILVVLAVIGSGILLRELFSAKNVKTKTTNSTGKRFFFDGKEMVLILIILFYVFALDVLGTLVGSFLVFFIIAVCFHRFKIKQFSSRNWLNVTIVSMVFIGILYWVFASLLGVQFPKGLFDF